MTELIRRKLIEVALPLEAINVASAREKSIRHGHPSTLHLWWARRPLAACRAVLFASLVDDPSSDPDRFPTPKAVEDERTRLFGIIERLVLWENSTNDVVLEEARVEIRRSTGGSPPPVLDPFCGGGSIPLEAQRLGLAAYASDLNPVAVLITKALIEIPAKFANKPPVHRNARRGVGASGAWKGTSGLAEDVRRYGAWMRDEAERRIGHLYPKVRLPKEQGGGEATVVAWLWARSVTCPNPACHAQMPLARSFALSTKKGQEVWLVPVVDADSRSVRFRVHSKGRDGNMPREASRGTSALNDKGQAIQATFRCVVCSSGLARGEYIDAEATFGRMNAMLLAVVAQGPRHRVYVEADETQLSSVATAAEAARSAEVGSRLPSEPARGTFASNAQGRYYGFRQFRDYFTPRQLVALSTFVDLANVARGRASEDARVADPRDRALGDAGEPEVDAYAGAIATYLAFAISKIADRGSSLTRWMPTRDSMYNTFSRQALSMSWDYVEVNPLGENTGGFAESLRWTVEALEGIAPSVPGHAIQQDAVEINPAIPPIVSTDPPYYNNIAYADLSDFFYVWLRRSLGDVYPELFSTLLTPKAGELIASPYRFDGDQSAADEHFESGLADAFRRIRAVSDPTMPVTVYYAFKQSETEDTEDGSPSGATSTGWETMLEGLLGAGFSIVGTWPVRTELANRLVGKDTNALASSIVLVCRPRSIAAGITTRKDLVAALKREMPEALRTLQHGNIAPVDLAQASIGPGMSVFSRYAKVLEPDGSAMRVRTALALINQVLDEILAAQEGEFDADTRWAIAWYEQFGLAEADFGTAETLSRAKDTSVAGLVRAGIVAAARGRVRLLSREEYGADWDPATDDRVPAWEATQRLVNILLVNGEAPAGDLLARLGGLGDTARDLAYRLFVLAERKAWTDDARAFNALVVAWPDLVRGAEQARIRRPAQASLGLE